MTYLQESQVETFLALDQQVYPGVYQVPAFVTQSRLQRNPRTDLTVMDGDRLVGYISLLPVPSAVFQAISRGTVSEQEIENQTVSFDRPGFYDAYLSSLVIDKQGYPRFSGKWLFAYLEHHLRRLRKEGRIISRIVAVAVSPAGRKSLLRAGFRESAGRSNVFYYMCRQHLPSFLPRSRPLHALMRLLAAHQRIQWRSV